jgi:serine/threonine-protein kinase RsbW
VARRGFGGPHWGNRIGAHHYSSDAMTDPLAPSPTATDGEHVVMLSLPLHLRHASTARMLAASLAADAGFNVDEIDDLRLGVNEVVSVLADDPSTDRAARLAIEFTVSSGRVAAIISRTDGEGAVEIDELAQRILDAVLDRYDYARGTFRISKTVAPRDDAD